MADLEFSGSSQNPQFGLDPSDYAGYGSGGNQTDPFSGSQLAGAGALGIGALGFGALLAQGPGSLPPQFGEATGNAPFLTTTGQTNIGAGEALVAQGTDALRMGQAGTLTPEQQAQLKQFSSGETNKARQMFYSMGRNPDADTAFLSESGNIDTRINAMAQAQIQTTIQLGLGEISGGGSLISAGTGQISAANSVLLAAGEAQLKADQAYSSNLTSAFTAIGTMFAKAAPMLAA